MIVVLILAGILIFIGFAFYKYFKSPEKILEIGANMESVLLSEDGKTAYIKLAGESNKNITKIKFIFSSGEKEYKYETSEGAQEISVPYRRGFWDWLFGKKLIGNYEYKIDNNQADLDNFHNIENVSVVFIYQEEGRIIETPRLDTGTTALNRTTNRTTTSWGGGGTGDDGITPSPEPTPTCTDTCTSLSYECGM